MTTAERCFHHLSNVLVGGTGLVYLVMVALLKPADPWAVVNSPWQPLVQHSHVLVAPLLVFSVGILWKTHALLRMRLQGGLRVGSGSLLVLMLLPMVLSGVALQTSEDADWRLAWAWVHGVSGCLWVVSYAVHWLRRRARARTVAVAGG
ncbi:MAG: hypothetical protein GXP62_03975 [Oligoflexia bacterium]|nr:hypothetical protein [Oligoflexia bacterium]